MTKAPAKLTKIQAKALDFIRSSLERSGTSPTLRELCAFMGYSAIGSAQDLVAALRRKEFLQTPSKQSARALILTPKALAMFEPTHQSTPDTFVINCLEGLPADETQEASEDRVGTLRISVNMFQRPYPSPESLFALKAANEGMHDAGIMAGDWMVVNRCNDAESGSIVVAKVGNEAIVGRLQKDRLGNYIKPENTSFSIVRESEEAALQIVGTVIAVQRIM